MYPPNIPPCNHVKTRADVSERHLEIENWASLLLRSSEASHISQFTLNGNSKTFLFIFTRVFHRRTKKTKTKTKKPIGDKVGENNTIRNRS